MKGIEEKQIEAPYELPEGWTWVKQNEVCKLTDGEKLSGIEYPYLEVKYLRGTKEKVFQSSGKFVIKGTKVILVDGENSGEVFSVPEDGFMGSTFKALSIQNVNEKYLQLFITTKKDLYRNNKKGSAIPHLNKELFFNMPFPLPPTLAEQQRIVNRIESMFVKLDEAKEKAQNVVDGFETRKAAILHNAFTGELTAKWRKENGESDDSWVEKRFDEFCLLKRGFDLPATQRIEGMYPLVSSSGIIDTHNEAKVKAPGIVTGRSGSIGKVFYIEEDFFPLNTTLYSQNLFGNNARYVYYYLSNFDFKSFSSSTAVPTLNRNNFSKVELKVPTLPEQVEIVRILDIIIEKENKAKQAAETVLEQIDLLKKSILALAFRGEL